MPLYDSLFYYFKMYDMATAVLKKYNPCKDCDTHWCCKGCEYLNKETGCTIKLLSCRVWLCFQKRDSHPEAAAELAKIRGAAPGKFYADYVRYIPVSFDKQMLRR